MSQWFGEYWDKTMKDERGNVELESANTYDPFNIFPVGDPRGEGVIQFTTPLFAAGKSTPVGLIGIHFRRDLFKLLIEPLTRLSEQSKRSVHPSFWVYSEHQLQEPRWGQYDKPTYGHTSIEHVHMTEQAMQQLINTLFKEEVQEITIDDVEYLGYS